MLPGRRVIDQQRSPYSTSACQSGLRQNLQEMQNGFPADDDDFPRGVIIWWTGTIDNIPEGWVLADGSHNHPPIGSGFNLIGRFVQATHTDEDLGMTNPASPTEPSSIVTGEGRIEVGHSHEVVLTLERLDVEFEMFQDLDSANISVTHELDEEGFPHDHIHHHRIRVGEVKGDLKTEEEEDDEHTHALAVEMDTLFFTEAPDKVHKHGMVLTEAEVDDHPAADIVAAMNNGNRGHANHSHFPPPGGFSTADIAAQTGPGVGAPWLFNETLGLDAQAVDDDGDVYNFEHTAGAAAVAHREDHDHKEGDNSLVITATEGENHHLHVMENHSHGAPDKEGLGPFDDGLRNWPHQHRYPHTHIQHDAEGEEIWVTVSSVDADHDHGPVTSLHTHEIFPHNDRHRHDTYVSEEGAHTHITGNPVNMQLLPIERI